MNIKKHWYLIFSVILIFVAIFLRLYHLSARAPFDWDQNRDYQVISEISRGKPILIGPVAKGEGGFFLGPLYYYLATPAFILSNGNPISLPITSVVLDVLALVAILSLLPQVWCRRTSIVLGSIWTYSFFAIEASHVSWNVALLPLYSILLIYFATCKSYSRMQNLLFGILLGLSWHVHASLIPLIPLFVIILFLFKRLGWRELPILIFGYILSLSPLILFDLRHNFLNWHLLTSFGQASATHTVNFVDLTASVFSRFGKNIYAILLGSSDLHLWWGISLTILSILAVLRGTLPARISGLIILLNLLLVFSLREVGFPEYYFGVSYLPALIIILDMFNHFPLISRCALTLTLIASILIGYRTFSTELTSYSLGQKQKIVQTIGQMSKTVELHYDLPFGRDTGFPILLKQSAISIDDNAKLKFVITEKMEGPVILDGELTQDIGYFGGMRLTKLVVQ